MVQESKIAHRTSHIAHRTSHIAYSCPICGSNNLETINTVVGDFVMARISSSFDGNNNYPTKLCFCKECSFAFFDYRLSEEEVNLLYADYRGSEYQKLRERYECWYTEKVNHAFDSDIVAVQEQRRIIDRIISSNVHKELRTALDYGGNEGRSFTALTGTREKYVFDISGVPTIDGVKSIASYGQLKNYSFDFIMCNHVFEHLTNPMEMMQNFKEISSDGTVFYIEVPSENPFVKKAGKYSIRKNISLLFNPNFSIWLLAKHYFRMKKKPFMPMGEHINFFTKQSICTMAERSGFTVIDVQENQEHTALGNWTILSMLFKL